MSKNKLQYVEKEIGYFGHVISEGEWRINSERIQGIVQLSLLWTKRELRSFFLGLIEYCKLWIEAYVQKQRVYLKLSEGEPNILKWAKKEKELGEVLKQDLITAPVLELPAL